MGFGFSRWHLLPPTSLRGLSQRLLQCPSPCLRPCLSPCPAPALAQGTAGTATPLYTTQRVHGQDSARLVRQTAVLQCGSAAQPSPQPERHTHWLHKLPAGGVMAWPNQPQCTHVTHHSPALPLQGPHSKLHSRGWIGVGCVSWWHVCCWMHLQSGAFQYLLSTTPFRTNPGPTLSIRCAAACRTHTLPAVLTRQRGWEGGKEWTYSAD